MKRVLIADDSSFMRKMIRTILEKEGYQIGGEAENAQESIKQSNLLHPDIVTMDITLPDMSGIEALKSIKTHNPNSKVVIVSSLGTHYHMMEALQSGADDFILKPINESRLIECLQHLN